MLNLSLFWAGEGQGVGSCMLTAMQYQLGVKMWLSRNPVALTTLQQLSTYIKTFLERSQDISNKNCHLKGKNCGCMYIRIWQAKEDMANVNGKEDTNKDE